MKKFRSKDPLRPNGDGEAGCCSDLLNNKIGLQSRANKPIYILRTCRHTSHDPHSSPLVTIWQERVHCGNVTKLSDKLKKFLLSRSSPGADGAVARAGEGWLIARKIETPPTIKKSCQQPPATLLSASPSNQLRGKFSYANPVLHFHAVGEYAPSTILCICMSTLASSLDLEIVNGR